MLPEVNRKQICTNAAQMDSSKLKSVQVGEVDTRYILMYNAMRNSADMLAPEVSEIIITLMKKYSKWVFVKNVITRLLFFDTKLDLKLLKKNQKKLFSCNTKIPPGIMLKGSGVPLST